MLVCFTSVDYNSLIYLLGRRLAICGQMGNQEEPLVL